MDCKGQEFVPILTVMRYQGGFRGLGALALVLGVSGCSFDRPSRVVVFKIDTSKLADEFSSKPAELVQSPGEGELPLPTQFFATQTTPSSGFACLAVNLTGPSIPKRPPPGNAQFCPAYQPKEIAAMATTIPLVAGQSEAQVALALPTGGAIGVEIWGVQTSTGTCPAIGPNAQQVPMQVAVYRLAQQSVTMGQNDLSSLVEVNQGAAFANLSSQKVFCEPAAPGGAVGGNGNGNYVPPAGQLSYTPVVPAGNPVPYPMGGTAQAPSGYQYVATLAAGVRSLTVGTPPGIAAPASYRLKRLAWMPVQFGNGVHGQQQTTICNDNCSFWLMGAQTVFGHQMMRLNQASGSIEFETRYLDAVGPNADGKMWFFDIEALNGVGSVVASVSNYMIQITRPQYFASASSGQGWNGSTFTFMARDTTQAGGAFSGQNDTLSVGLYQNVNGQAQLVPGQFYYAFGQATRKFMKNATVLSSSNGPGNWAEFYSAEGNSTPVYSIPANGQTVMTYELDQSRLGALPLGMTRLEYAIPVTVFQDSNHQSLLGSMTLSLRFERFLPGVNGLLTQNLVTTVGNPATPVVSVPGNRDAVVTYGNNPPGQGDWGSDSIASVAGQTARQLLVYEIPDQTAQMKGNSKLVLNLDVRGPVHAASGSLDDCKLAGVAESANMGSVNVKIATLQNGAISWEALDSHAMGRWDGWRNYRILDRTLNSSLVTSNGTKYVLLLVESSRTTQVNCQSRVGIANASLMFSDPLAAPPAGLSKISQNGSVGLSWSSVAGALSYEIQRSSSVQFTSVDQNYSSQQVSFVVSPLQNGQTHYFRVRAHLQGGGSTEFSQVIDAQAVEPGFSYEGAYCIPPNGVLVKPQVLVGSAPSAYEVISGALPQGCNLEQQTGWIFCVPSGSAGTQSQVSLRGTYQAAGVDTSKVVNILFHKAGAPASLTAGTGSFGSVATNVTHTLTLINKNCMASGPIQAQITGNIAAFMIVSNGCSGGLGVGATCEVMLTFLRSVLSSGQSASGTLQLSSFDSVIGMTEVQLSGTASAGVNNAAAVNGSP